MASKTYETGAAFERRVKAHFEKMGYTVIRSAGSHTVIDLTAFRGTDKLEVIVIQCKTTGVLPQWERDTLEALKKQHNFQIRTLHAFKGNGGHVEFEEL